MTSYGGLTAWSLDSRGGAVGSVAVTGDASLNNRNLNYLRLTIGSPGTGDTAGLALRNAGFNTGLHVAAGKRYRFSFWARRDGTADVPVRVRVEDTAGTTAYGTAAATVGSGGWKRYAGVLTATGTTTTGRLAVIVGGAPAAGTHVDFDMVSLLPEKTWKGHGLRTDLAQKIADLHPSFLRFPGGCIANVGSYAPFPERARIYRWKDTIGPVEQRPTNRNFWGYNQSYGLGFYEYLQFAEDLGAEPMPVVHVGVNGCGEDNRLTTDAELAPFIQDTLDLIEFANGSIATTWGARRAALGHPKPFGLKFISLGNEEIDPQFLANYPRFADAIRARYPGVKLICNSGQAASGAVFDRNWQMCRDENADLVDEHYYVNQTFLLNNTHRYDSYPRRGPHVFVGEYAARASSRHYNNFFSALSEAAYITGLERNSDVVEMASYAPLLANASYVNWSPDLIWFDNSRVYGTPSYWVQRLYSQNRGDTLVPTTLELLQQEPVESVGRVPGQFGNALQLNGLNRYVQLPAGNVSGLHELHDLGVGEPADGRRVGARVRLRLGPGREHVPHGKRERRAAAVRHHHERQRQRAAAERAVAAAGEPVDAPRRHPVGNDGHAVRERRRGGDEPEHDAQPVESRVDAEQLDRQVPVRRRLAAERDGGRLPDLRSRARRR